MLKVDVRQMSDRLAQDPAISDYDVWRALKSLEDELYEIENRRRPIPMDLIFARAILRRTQKNRNQF